MAYIISVFLLTIVMLFAHVGSVVVLHAHLYPIIILIVCYLFVTRPLTGLIMFVALLFFQNMVISIFSPIIHNETIFKILQGTNFFILLPISVISLCMLLYNRNMINRKTSGLIFLIVVFMCIAILYMVYGASQTGLTNSVIYFRNTVNGMLFLITGIFLGIKIPVRIVLQVLMVAGVAAIIFGIIEFTITEELYWLISEHDYFNWKYFAGEEYFRNAHEMAAANRQRFFNFSGSIFSDIGISSIRISGPNMHTISYAYILAVMSLIFIVMKKSYWLYITIPMIMIIGSKGAIIVLFTALALYIPFIVFRKAHLFYLSFIVFAFIYIGAVSGYGIITNDYHIIGLMGSIKGFIANPLGYGLGMGGNLSTTTQDINWQDFQKSGADIAVESAIGVMLYQIGIFTFMLIKIWINVIKYLTRNILESGSYRMMLFPVALGVCIINGVFQEEAFSPYSMGLLALICGGMIGNDALKTGNSENNDKHNIPVYT